MFLSKDGILSDLLTCVDLSYFTLLTFSFLINKIRTQNVFSIGFLRE